MGDNLKQKTVNALKWSTIDRFGQQAVQMIIGVILARLLSPSDYGLLGLIMIFSGLSFVLVESGFGQSLIRKKDANETDYNSVFYFNIFVSIFLYIILFFSIPYISNYFKHPQLVSIGRVIFLAILFNAFYLVPFAMMVKEMNFKSVAKVNFFATILSGLIGVTLAFLKYGVWSLVAQQVAFHFLRMTAYQHFVKWKPKALFSMKVILEFGSYSVHVLGTSVLNVIFNNLYVLILGKYYEKNDVGYYTQANKLSETFNFSFQQILLGSTFSMFSQIQEDTERLRRIFREITKKTALITIPVMLVFIAIAEPFISVLLSEKWILSVTYFQLLCLASVTTPFFALNISILNARGLSKITFKLELFKKGLILLSVLICFNYGIIAMLWGYAASNFVAYLISVVYVKKDIKHYIKNQLTDLLPGVILSLLTAIPALFLSFILKNNFVLLFTQILLVLLIYILSIRKIQPQLYDKAYSIIVENINKFAKKNQL